jgi:hypothetical protein
MQLKAATVLLLAHCVPSNALLVKPLASLQVRALRHGHKHVLSQKYSRQTVMLAGPSTQAADSKVASVTLQPPRPLPAAVTWAVFASVWATLTR